MPCNVTPFTGVWIEIVIIGFFIGYVVIVTPFTGVWIEIIALNKSLSPGQLSLPLRECGLKFYAT